MMKTIKQMIFLLAMGFMGLNLYAVPLATNFTYQGQLKVSNALANGNYDFQFTAYDTDGLSNVGTNLAQVQVPMVNVVNGVFTTQLDFSGMVFQGDKVWLEVAVRVGGSTGGYQQLLPRQEVTSAPYAIQAQFVSADAITGAEVLDSSITSADLGSNSVTSSQISTDAVGSTEIAANAITAVELADNSVDTNAIKNSAVTSIKIADGSITAADLGGDSVGSSEIIANAVGSSEIAANAVGSSEVNSTQVQLRVSSTCEENYALIGINADGSVQCRRIPIGLDYSIQTPAGSNGYSFTDIGISPITGFPMISFGFYNSISTFYELKLFICSDKSCSSGYVRTLDSTDTEINSLAFRANGNPIISYYGYTNGDLKVYDCDDSTCSSGTARTLYSTGFVGGYSSIVVDPATDRPIISYLDSNNSALRVYACANSQCSSALFNDMIDNSAAVGLDTDIAINPSTGLPQISYYDSTNGNLKFYTCSNAICSLGSTQVVDSGGNVGRYSSISYAGIAAFPSISYYDVTNTALKFAYCTSNNCLTKSIKTLDNGGNVGSYSSAVYNPVTFKTIISYYDSTNGHLKVFVCNDVSCLTGGVATTVDTSSLVGQYSSMVVAADGLPDISYVQNDSSHKALKVFSCGDFDCQR